MVMEETLKKAYDHIIVGGGTAGLCLAARLSEDQRCTVLVLEAGEPNLDEQTILIAPQYGASLGNPKYAWQHETVPQEHSNGRKYGWPRGKGLGGSSAVNFSGWTRPLAQDINAFERLGNQGWNWARYLEYSKRSESFHYPDPETVRATQAAPDPKYHGTNGGIHTSFPPLFTWDAPILQTWNNLGIPTNKEPQGGNNLGAAIFLNSYDPATSTRSYAATAFYLTNTGRTNLRVITSAHVHRLIIKKESSGKVTATGVEFIHEGTPLVANATREVVLCAGALKSPQILELSGIGDRSILEPLGIQVNIDIPGVGSNAQDHTVASTSFELRAGYESLDALRDPEIAKEAFRLHKGNRGLFTHGAETFAFVPLHQISHNAADMLSRQETKVQQNAATYSPSRLEQYQIQLENLKSEAIPDMEMIAFPMFFSSPNPPENGKNYISMLAVLNRPFSRGTVHITTQDPTVDPAMDPHYFEENIDLEMLIETIKYIRKLPLIEPFKSLVVKELNPGPEISEAGLADWIKDSLQSMAHTAGTLSMLPFEKGGVVDTSLKVYNTTNIRVADLSIVPLHITAHPQATVYAIAEQAADIIKGKI